MQIRKANKEDLKHITDLHKDLISNDAPLPSQKELDEIWKSIINSPIINYFVVEENNKILATCNLTITPNLTRGGRPYGLIENVVTKKDYQNKGYGTALLKSVLDYAWKNNCYKVMLLTSNNTEKIFNFYEKVGFKRGIKTGFIAYPQN